MVYRAFIEDDDTPFRIEYYHNPKRWEDNFTDRNNPIMMIEDWSYEIKFMNQSYDDISDEINNLPNEKGGNIYVLY